MDSINNIDDANINPYARILALFIEKNTSIFYWCMSTTSNVNKNCNTHKFSIGEVYEYRIEVKEKYAKFY